MKIEDRARMIAMSTGLPTDSFAWRHAYECARKMLREHEAEALVKVGLANIEHKGVVT